MNRPEHERLPGEPEPAESADVAAAEAVEPEPSKFKGWPYFIKGPNRGKRRYPNPKPKFVAKAAEKAAAVVVQEPPRPGVELSPEQAEAFIEAQAVQAAQQPPQQPPRLPKVMTPGARNFLHSRMEARRRRLLERGENLEDYPELNQEPPPLPVDEEPTPEASAEEAAPEEPAPPPNRGRGEPVPQEPVAPEPSAEPSAEPQRPKAEEPTRRNSPKPTPPAPAASAAPEPEGKTDDPAPDTKKDPKNPER